MLGFKVSTTIEYTMKRRTIESEVYAIDGSGRLLVYDDIRKKFHWVLAEDCELVNKTNLDAVDISELRERVGIQ